MPQTTIKLTDRQKEVRIINTWSQPGSYSRYDTWRFAERQIENWLIQKNYADYKKPFGTVNLCRKFAKAHNFKGSNTDVLILAYQNFKDFRLFVNELKN